MNKNGEPKLKDKASAFTIHGLSGRPFTFRNPLPPFFSHTHTHTHTHTHFAVGIQFRVGVASYTNFYLWLHGSVL